MRQFEIWWAELPQPAGTASGVAAEPRRRLCLSEPFVVAEITTTVRNIPVEVLLGKREGLTRDCVVNCDNLRTISRQALVQRISRLPVRREKEVKRAVGYALDWEELIEAGASHRPAHFFHAAFAPLERVLRREL